MEEQSSEDLKDWSVLKRLMSLLGPHWPAVALSVVCAVGVMTLQILGPLLISVAIDRYLLAGQKAGWLNAFLPKGAGEGLRVLSFAYLLVLLLNFAFETVQAYLAQWTGQKAMLELRRRLFDHLQDLEIPFYDANPVGRLVTRVTNDVEALSEIFSNGIVGMLANLMMMLFFLLGMMTLNARLTLLLAGILPIFIVLTVIFRRAVTETQQRARILLARINAFIAEHVNGIAVLQLFNREEESLKRFEDINKKYTDASKGWVTANSWFMPLVELLGTISQGGLMVAGAMLLGGGGLTVGILVAFLQYGAKFLRPIQEISERYGILQASVVSAERVFQLLDQPATAREHEGVEPPIPEGAGVEFDHVWFAYQGEDWVLRDTSFRIESGESVAVVGHTGAGKTTLINLLLRFYEPQRGEIRLGGVNIKRLSRETLRKQFGTVLQDTHVHEGTILDNIRLGLDEITERAALDSAERVSLTDSIPGLPDGLNTKVMERGDNLSTGQKQLIGFARALTHDPRVLILDEATSSVDMETEGRIQRAMAGMVAGRTSIIIAHRLSTVLHVDRILVMHKGQVRESGTHAQLMALGGIYRKIYQLQFRREAPAAVMA